MPSYPDAPHKEGPADHEGHVPERCISHHIVHAAFGGSDSGECGVAKLGGARGCLVEFDRASDWRGEVPIEGQVPEREGPWPVIASPLRLAGAVGEPYELIDVLWRSPVSAAGLCEGCISMRCWRRS